MKAYRIERDGTITVHEGDPDFFMDEDDDISWGSTDAPAFPGHDLCYDEEAISDPGEVRAEVAGIEIPLPAWFVGVDGEDTCSPRIDVESLRRSIRIPR